MKAKGVILIVFLVSWLVTAAFGGGKQEAEVETGKKITLDFWNYWDGKNGEVLKSLLEEYQTANPNITITNIFIGWGELLPKLQTASAGGKMPDLAAVDLVWMPKLAGSGALTVLNDSIKKSGLDIKDFYPELLKVSRYNGNYYSLPVSTNNLELFYNKDMFRAAGLEINKAPKTWAELAEYGGKLTKADGSQWGFEVFTQPGEGLTWQSQVYIWQTGADFLDEGLAKPAFDSPGGVKAISFLVDLVRKSKIAPLTNWGVFGQGKAAMVMDGSWMVGIWSESAPFDWGTAPMPIPEGGKPATNMGGEQIFIGKTTPENEASAWNFIYWFTGTAAQVKWDMGTGFMPIRDSVAKDSTYRNWITSTESRLWPFVESQKYAHSRPAITNYPEVSDAYSTEIEKAFYGKLTPEEALKSAAARVAPLLKK
ncbi:MAG: ABC transporter substrate-binding protein [Spirochaetota bacterium]